MKKNIFSINKLKYLFVEVLGYFYASPKSALKKILNKKNHKSYYENTNDDFYDDDIFLENTIIVIDDSVCEYDVHAGARTIFMYLKLFVDIGLNVVFIPRDFIRKEPYVTQLKNLNIKILYGNFYKKNYMSLIYENRKKIKYVMLNRPRSFENLWFFKKYTDAKIIYYGMDMYSVREKCNYDVSHEKWHLRASKYFAKIEKYLYDNSDVIVTVSNKEKNEIKKLTYKKIYYMPCFFYDEIEKISYNFDQRNGLLFVGGQKHPPNEDAVMWFAETILSKIKNNSIKFVVIGKYDVDFISKYSKYGVIFAGNISDKQLKDVYSSSRLVVIPLRYGAGVKGKTIEAMKNGLPIIATDYGTEGLEKKCLDFIESANSSQEFIDKILCLYDDDKKLTEMSAKSYEYISKNFNYNSAKKIILEILNNSFVDKKYV